MDHRETVEKSCQKLANGQTMRCNFGDILQQHEIDDFFNTLKDYCSLRLGIDLSITKINNKYHIQPLKQN